jgi:regulatory protein
LLNIRFLSEGELRKKLKAKDVPEDIADEVLVHLKEEHFIDDDRLAREVYRLYVNKNQYGHLYICNRLRRRFLPVPEDIERVDEYAVAVQLIRKRFPDSPRDPRKIARFLQYRGFSMHIISEIINDQ